MRILFIPLTMMIPIFLFGQKGTAQIYKPLLIKADIDTLISNLKEFHPTFTKMTNYTSLSKIYMPCNNNDTVKGVLPDYIVMPTLEDLLNDKDYAVESTLKMIRENKTKK